MFQTIKINKTSIKINFFLSKNYNKLIKIIFLGSENYLFLANIHFFYYLRTLP